MIFTIEPGLYFREDDLLIPPEYRGIGIRIEDDVLMTENGPEWISAGIPKQTDDVEVDGRHGRRLQGLIVPIRCRPFQRGAVCTQYKEECPSNTRIRIGVAQEEFGHDLLWLNGVTGCVLDDRGRLLLGRRSDTGEWAMVYGINEPGGQPADTVVREIKEETGIDAVVTDLVAVTSSSRVSPMRTATIRCTWTTRSCALSSPAAMPSRMWGTRKA